MKKNPDKINKMFSEIAPRYDLANAVLSLNLYKTWYKKIIKLTFLSDNFKILDLATGTGNLALEFAKSKFKLDIVGIDFNSEMLSIAEAKASKIYSKQDQHFQLYNKGTLTFQNADALNLPFDDNSFDYVTICFGIRNVSSINECLNEISRVLKPGGKCFILEFGKPSGLFKIMYFLYSKIVIELIGRIITKSNYAYKYLTSSSNSFPSKNDFLNFIIETKLFENPGYRTIMGGTAYIYFAEKSK